jgi:hypothetical protein
MPKHPSELQAADTLVALRRGLYSPDRSCACPHSLGIGGVRKGDLHAKMLCTTCSRCREAAAWAGTSPKSSPRGALQDQ